MCVVLGRPGKHQQARDQAKQFLHLAQCQERGPPRGGPSGPGSTVVLSGDAQAHEHFAQSIALYDPQRHRTLAFAYGQDPGVAALMLDAWTLWILGYPDQALRRSHEACTLAEDLAHPYTLAYVSVMLAMFHQYRRDPEEARRHAEAATRLCREQGFPSWLGVGLILQGWACATRLQPAEQIAAMHEGLAIYRATASALWLPYFLTLLAENYGNSGPA